MRHKVLHGKHTYKGITYKKGECFNSPVDLSLTFLNKFEIIIPPPIPLKKIPVAQQPLKKIPIEQQSLKKVILLGSSGIANIKMDNCCVIEIEESIQRKTVVQKGIAGLGNRIQVLGHCFDIAVKNDAQLLVDWRDTSWGGNFSNYFNISSPLIKDFEEGQFTTVKPKWWSDKINAKCAKKLAGEDFKRANKAIIDSKWNTLVVCQYKAVYTDALLLCITPVDRIFDIADKIDFMKEPYDCWHIRATDKTAGDPYGILEKINLNKAFTLPKVIITDNLDVKNKAIEYGMYCQSLIPPVPKRNGVHHSTDKYLEEAGITRQELNDSALVDLLIGKGATNFYPTCKNSSYSQLINRIRGINNGKFKR